MAPTCESTRNPLALLNNPRLRDEISKADALVIIHYLRPRKFAEEREGIALFAESIFKARQTIPFGLSINRNSYLPTKTAINASLEKLVHDWRTSFGKLLKDELTSSGRAVTIDVVTLKVQDRHFLDFTVHHMHMTEPKSVLEKPRFSIVSSTVLFIKGPDISSGANKRALLDENLRSSYGVDFNSVQKRFTIITDGEASMPRKANSSVRSRVCARDEKWIRCCVHVLYNCMKSAFSVNAVDSILQKLGSILDLSSVLLRILSAMVGTKTFRSVTDLFKMLNHDLVLCLLSHRGS